MAEESDSENSGWVAIHDVEDEEILKISDFRNDVEAKFSDWTLARLRGSRHMTHARSIFTKFKPYRISI